MEVDTNGLWVKPDDLGKRVTILKVNFNKLQELHERYGHISFPALKKLPEAKDIPPEEFAKAECIPCIKGKSTKPVARPSDIEVRTQETLERLHCYLIGPMETEWLGKKYVLTIIDDFSRYCIAIPIQSKSDTTETLKQAIKEIQLATGRKVKSIQAAWGGEFKNAALNSWCKTKGIIQKETVAYHSETNAIVERLNRALQDIARTAMIGAELKGLWGDAIKWAAYTKNRIPHENLTGMTPAQIFLLKEVPTRSNLRPFGHRVMVHIYKDQRDGQWAPRAQEARIIGYTETHGVYQVITPTGKRLISKDPRPIREELDEPTPKKKATSTTGPEELSSPPEITKPKEPRRSTRSGRDNRPFNQREKEGLYGAPQINKLRLIVSRIGHDSDHPTEEQVNQSPNAKEWEEAREKERQKLRKYGVYSIVPNIPNGHRAVDTKWVYDVKRDKEGNLLRRRARKVGRGFTQEYGKTYGDTHSQMARSETWRILLTLAIHNKLHVKQWDVVAAYLNAPLTHEVYVKDEQECWRLHKALYGLKQAGHEWYNTLRNIMTKSGLQQCIGDPGVFQMKHPDLAIVTTHVDDMAIFAPKEATITTIELAIERYVEHEKLGTPAKLLGMELTWGSGYVKLTQQAAIGNLAREFEIPTTEVPTKSLPLNADNYAKVQEETNPELQKKYQSLVGSLLYIARHTRPEITLHTNLLGRRTSNATPSNLKIGLQILKYLVSSSENGIKLQENQGQTLEENTIIRGYADASYGGEKARSQSGSLVTLNKQAVIWTSRRQDTIAQSITEAEYIAYSETAKDLRWITQFLEEVLGPISAPILYGDNEAAIKMTKTQTFHRRTRHIEHRHHFIRELVDKKLIIVKGIKGKENPADPLTKLLPMIALRNWTKESFNG